MEFQLSIVRPALMAASTCAMKEELNGKQLYVPVELMPSATRETTQKRQRQYCSATYFLHVRQHQRHENVWDFGLHSFDILQHHLWGKQTSPCCVSLLPSFAAS